MSNTSTSMRPPEVRFDFSGRRVLVTGGGKGIGREIALFLGSCDAGVVVISRGIADLDPIGCHTLTADL